MSSKDARRFGEKVEEAMADEYQMEIDRGRHRDVVDGNGRPWQVKGTMRRLSAGRRGRFRVWDEEGDNVDGYIFAVYDPDETSPIITHTKLSTDELHELIDREGIAWSSAGSTATAGERQAKVVWSYVFPELAEQEHELF